jgi:hypothetical protein
VDFTKNSFTSSYSNGSIVRNWYDTDGIWNKN